MTHTFFQSNTYTTLSNTDVGDKSQFICECSYAPDTRIQIKYNDMVMAERHLGSCVAEDVAKWFEIDKDGVVDDMIKQALPEAEQACRNLLNDLLDDFG